MLGVGLNIVGGKNKGRWRMRRMSARERRGREDSGWGRIGG